MSASKMQESMKDPVIRGQYLAALRDRGKDVLVRDITALIDSLIEVAVTLEAAERERDELRAEQTEHDEQIARMESKFSLAKRALDSKTARCEKAEAELRRRDAAAGESVAEIKWDGTELTVQNVRHGFSYGVTQVYAAAQSSAVAGAGEPVAYQIHSDLEGWRECTPERYAEVSGRPLIDGKYSGGWLMRKLYTASQPAVLPELEQDVKNIIGLLSGNEWAEHCTKSALGRKLENEITELHNTYSRAPAVLPPAMTYAEALKVSDWKNDQASIWVEGANWMRQQCLELGAQQQQKVVQLPNVYTWSNSEVVYLAALKQALDAAGVKWEVKS